MTTWRSRAKTLTVTTLRMLKRTNSYQLQKRLSCPCRFRCLLMKKSKIFSRARHTKRSACYLRRSTRLVNKRCISSTCNISKRLRLTRGGLPTKSKKDKHKGRLPKTWGSLRFLTMSSCWGKEVQSLKKNLNLSPKRIELIIMTSVLINSHSKS